MSKPTVTINGQQLADQARVSLTAGDWTIEASDQQAFVNVVGVPRARARHRVTITSEAGKSYNVAVTGGFFAVLTATAPVQDPKPEPKPHVPIRFMEGSTDVVDAAFVARSRAATVSGPFGVRKWATLTRTLDGFGNIKAIADQAKTIIAGGGIPLVTIHIWRDDKVRPTVYPVVDENKAAEQGRKACAQMVAAGMPKGTVLNILNEVNNHWMSFFPGGDWRLGYRWAAKFGKAFRDAGYKIIGPSMAGFYHLAQQVCDYIEANGLQTAFDGICWNFYGEKGATPVQTRHAACVKVMLDFAAKHGIEAWGIECGPPFNETEAIYAEYTPHVIANVSKLHGWGFWRQEMLPRWDTRTENGKTVLADSALYRRDKTPYPLLAVYQRAIGEKPVVTEPVTPTLTPDQRAVFDTINATRVKAGLPACTWDNILAGIATTALSAEGLLAAHPAAAGGRGFGMFERPIAVLLADMPTNTTNEGVIARQKILDPSHKRLGVGIGDGGFYAVFGV